MLGLGLFYGACVGFRRVCLVFGCVGLTRLTRALVLEYYNQGTNGLLHPCNDPAADLMQGYHGRHLNNPQSLGKVSFLTDYC